MSTYTKMSIFFSSGGDIVLHSLRIATDKVGHSDMNWLIIISPQNISCGFH